MYLHIGKNVIINSKAIIGIFDLEAIKEPSEEFFSNIEKETVNNSEEANRTFILVEKEKKYKGYITNISSTTLEKRAINGGFNG